MTAITVNGQWSLNLPAHRAEQWERWNYTWEAERLASIFANSAMAGAIFDVGAECGDFSALFARWGWEVVCMEPSPDYWPTIRETFEMNGQRPIGCFAGFASSESNVHPGTIAHAHGYPPEADAEYEGEPSFRHLSAQGTIPSIRIDDYTEWVREAPSAMSIDVEGSEFRVLKGAEFVLQNYRPLVWCSVHPEFMWENYDDYEGELRAWMSGLGYRAFDLGYDHEHHVLWFPDEKRDAVALPGRDYVDPRIEAIT